MKPEELKKYQQNDMAALFKVTSRCNDNCSFCIEKKFMKKERDDLSLAEIKENFNYLQERFKISYAVISGGEPTLHADFFGILDYFHKEGVEFRFITNFIKLGENRFFKKLLPYFPARRGQTGPSRENKIIGSINDLPGAGATAGKRIVGLKNVLRHSLPLMLIIVIYKKNVEKLSNLIFYLAGLFKQYGYDKPVNIELRLIYIEGTLNSLLKKSLPDNFKQIQESARKAVLMANGLGVTVTFWNFPLCYLENLPSFQDKSIQERRRRKLLKINKDFQRRKIKARDFEEYLKKAPACTKCKYDNLCSGIDGIYLEKYHFSPLRPFK